MSSELERRLEGVFAEAPEPDPGAGEEALHRALRALRPVAAPRRGLRAAVLAFAAAVVLLVIAAGSLAAAGALHVSFGAKPKPHRATTQLVLPQGANGVAAVVDGRLSVVTKDGLSLEGQPSVQRHCHHARSTLPPGSATPSSRWRRTDAGPGPIPPAEGSWRSPGRRTASASRTSPTPARHFVLHVIYGNGIRDTTIDRSVRAVRPSWRGNSLAFAYVGGGGRAIVYDVGHESRHVVAVRPPVTGLAFAPSGGALALEGTNGVSLVEQSAYRHIAAPDLEAFGWLNGRLAVACPARTRR